MSTKVLITGASGFVGSHLAQQLNPDVYEVWGTVFGEEQPLTSVKEDKQIKLNLRQRDEVAKLIAEIKPDWIFHLAALSSPAKSFEDPHTTISNNVEAQINIMDAARQLPNLPRILIVGSAEEYGKVIEANLSIDEKVALNPMSPYAVSKITQDYLGLQYYLSYKLPIIRVRPFNHVGERQSEAFVMAAFAKQIAQIEAGLQEPVIRVGNLETERDFTDVKDMVRAYELALQQGIPGEVYNLGSGTSISIQHVLNEFLAIATRPITIEVDPTRVMKVDVPRLRCDASKFKTLTGWEPRVPLKETISRVLNYWRDKVTSYK